MPSLHLLILQRSAWASIEDGRCYTLRRANGRIKWADNDTAQQRCLLLTLSIFPRCSSIGTFYHPSTKRRHYQEQANLFKEKWLVNQGSHIFVQQMQLLWICTLNTAAHIMDFQKGNTAEPFLSRRSKQSCNMHGARSFSEIVPETQRFQANLKCVLMRRHWALV